MAEFTAFAKNVEVLGESMLCIIESMGEHASLAWRILARHGIRRIERTVWYPQQPYLDVHKAIAEEIGEYTLLSIGKRIPDFVNWPPGIKDVLAGLRSIDIAYHINHRINGAVMFDPQTGEMLEGIGHYKITSEEKRRVVMVCNTPYPSEFDRGIVVGIAQRFKSHAQAVLDTSKPTRKKGAESCTYIVSW